MKIEFDIEIPNVEVIKDSVDVVCGSTKIKLVRVNDASGLSGGDVGDWIPEYDWRKNNTDNDEDRRGYALPYNLMIEVAKEAARKGEQDRLITKAAHDIAESLRRKP